MTKIIVPIDFSEYSEYALKAASKLAAKHHAELLVLHMLEMSDIILSASDDFQNQKTVFFYKLAEQKIEDFLKKDYLKTIKVTSIIKHFKVFSEVNDVAKKHEADLIVMGSHGVSGVKEFFVGSNTERVVRHSDIPVLVVKNDIPNTNFDTVVYATDFSEESIKAYQEAKKLFNNTESTLHIVHVNLPNEVFKSTAELEKIRADFFEKAGTQPDHIKSVNLICDYTVEDGILNFANSINADLIAIPTHGRTGLAHFFEGSIGEDIANHASLPVMTFKI